MKILVPFAKVLTVIAMPLLLVGCGATEPDRPQVDAPQPEVSPPSALIKKSDLLLMPVANGERKMTSEINGRVIPGNSTQIFAEVQGRIEPTSLVFKAGINFNKGDILVKIDQQEFALNLEAQRSAFLNALTGILPDLKSDYPDSYEQWLAYVDAYHFGNALQELPEPKSSEEKFFLTSNQVYHLFFQIKSLEERLSKYTIYAPYAGTITAANIDIGSLVSPGQPLGTISNRYQYELEAGVPMKAINHLKIGTKVQFTNHQTQGIWTGRVARINNIVDPQTQNIPVYFRLEGKDLRTGMYLEGQIKADQLDAITVIPNKALGRDKSVLILQQDVILRKAVQPIEFLTDSIIVEGLESGDLVILDQFDIPVEGSKVEL